jgi:hypothetical protein
MKKLLVLSTLLLLACGKGESVDPSTAALTEQNTKLTQDKEDLCAITVEIVGNGEVMYIGDKTFVRKNYYNDDEFFPFDNMLIECNDMLDNFREAIEDRQDNWRQDHDVNHQHSPTSNSITNNNKTTLVFKKFTVPNTAAAFFNSK